jgi:hypothetical protein
MKDCHILRYSMGEDSYGGRVYAEGQQSPSGRNAAKVTTPKAGSGRLMQPGGGDG